MAIARDIHTTAVKASASSWTMSHTCTGSDLYLVVGMFLDDTTVDKITGVTYNSVAMTRLSINNPGANRQVLQYGLLGPSTGANNVVVSLSSANSGDLHAISYTGVGDGGSTGGSDNVSTSTTASSSHTTNAADCWIVSMVRDASGAPTSGTNCTFLDADSTMDADSNASVGAAGSKTVAYTGTGGAYSNCFTSIAPGTQAVATSNNLLLLGVS